MCVLLRPPPPSSLTSPSPVLLRPQGEGEGEGSRPPHPVRAPSAWVDGGGVGDRQGSGAAARGRGSWIRGLGKIATVLYTVYTSSEVGGETWLSVTSELSGCLTRLAASPSARASPAGGGVTQPAQVLSAAAGRVVQGLGFASFTEGGEASPWPSGWRRAGEVRDEEEGESGRGRRGHAQRGRERERAGWRWQRTG